MQKCPMCKEELPAEKLLVSLDLNHVAYKGMFQKLCPNEAVFLHTLNEAYPEMVTYHQMISKLWGNSPPKITACRQVMVFWAGELRKFGKRLGFNIKAVKDKGYRLELIGAP